MSSESTGPVFHQTNMPGSTGAQGTGFTQNITTTPPRDLPALITQLTAFAAFLDLADVSKLQNPDIAPEERHGAWQRIRGALTHAGTAVAAASIVSAGDQLISAIK